MDGQPRALRVAIWATIFRHAVKSLHFGRNRHLLSYSTVCQVLKVNGIHLGLNLDFADVIHWVRLQAHSSYLSTYTCTQTPPVTMQFTQKFQSTMSSQLPIVIPQPVAPPSTHLLGATSQPRSSPDSQLSTSFTVSSFTCFHVVSCPIWHLRLVLRSTASNSV